MDRRSYRCEACGSSTPIEVKVPFDHWAGLGSDHLTPRACRLVALAGGSWSFDVAAERLKEMCRIHVSDQTVRRVCDRVGQEAKRWMDESASAIQGFERAEGHVEYYTDGTMVNTIDGWREMRLNVFAKREAGEPTPLDRWNDRVLPEAKSRLAFALLAPAQEVGQQMGRTKDRLGLGRGKGVSVLADGARWIWNQARRHLPDSDQVLDVYHLLEHLHAAAGVLHGVGTDTAGQWVDQQLMTLMRQGSRRYLSDELIPQLKAARLAAPESPGVTALRQLCQYVWSNRGRLGYAKRLEAGLPIGSGQVEGACKTIVGRRLKLNSARWRPQRAQHMAALCCLEYSQRRQAFWLN